MRSRFAPAALRCHFLWLLVWACLGPLAQVASYSHVLTHLPPGVAEQGDTSEQPGKAHLDLCELCLNAAALGGGALPSAALVLAAPVLPRGTPCSPGHSVWLLPTPRPYHSQAPPAILS